MSKIAINDQLKKDMNQSLSKKLQQKYKDMLSLLLYQSFNGSWISNSVIQGSNSTKGKVHFIFRQYPFSLSFNYDLVLYDYETNIIPQGIVLSNNESFSATRNQSNSLNISIDDNSLILSSIKSIYIKSLTQYSSQLIMMTEPATFILTLNQSTMIGYINIEIGNVSIIINLQPGKVWYYYHDWMIAMQHYTNYLSFLLKVEYIINVSSLAGVFSPYTVLLYSIYNGLLLYQVSHLLFISKIHICYLPLFLLQLSIGLYWLPKTLLYIIKKKIPNSLTNETYNREKYKQIAFYFVLYVTILSLFLSFINSSYYYRWRIAYYILLMFIVIPRIINIRNFGDIALSYCDYEYQAVSSPIVLIELRQYKVNVLITRKSLQLYDMLILILLFKLAILLYFKSRNWIKINIFKMEWHEVYFSFKELKSKDIFECSICLDYYIGNNNEDEKSSNAFVLNNPSIEKGKERNLNGVISGLLCCFKRKSINRKPFNEETPLITLCKHTFHKGCIEAWLKKSEICPMCRSLIL